MDKEKILNELARIIIEYVEDPITAQELCNEANKNTVKFVLAEIERYRKKEYSGKDHELIKDLFFYYC